MITKKKAVALLLFTAALVVFSGQNAVAQDEWKFGIGTGFSSFSLDGDLGFATPAGGVIFDVDLDNSDSSDLVESAFGFGGFARKGKWTILYVLGTMTLEDGSGVLATEWDRTQVEVSVVYNFAKTGNHAWGALLGVRNIDHDWTITTPTVTVDFDEDWTDVLIGVTHALPFAGNWSWTNRIDGGFGDSEGSFLFVSALNWQATEHWAFNFNIKQHSVEFGETEDIADADFYLYDVDEVGAGVGFMFTW